VGELGKLEHHLGVEEGDCGCVEVECEFGPVGCVAKLPRKDLQRHKEENVHKHLVLMSVMSLKSNEAFGRQLQEQRVEFQQQLKQKDEEIQAIQKSLQHLIEEKNEQLKVLQGQMEANKKRLNNVERKQQEEKQEMIDLSRRLGQADTSLGDIQGQVREVKELIQKLEQGYSETAEEIMGRLGQVESSLEESKTLVERMNDRVQKLEKHTFIPPPDFTMTDFELLKKDGDDWFSPPFYSHIEGYKLRLRVSANGQLDGKGTHVSLFVHLMRGEHDNCLKWPFCGDVHVRALNQRAEGIHAKCIFRFDDWNEVAGRVIER